MLPDVEEDLGDNIHVLDSLGFAEGCVTRAVVRMSGFGGSRTNVRFRFASKDGGGFLELEFDNEEEIQHRSDCFPCTSRSR